jgi:hypothetical protein
MFILLVIIPTPLCYPDPTPLLTHLPLPLPPLFIILSQFLIIAFPPIQPYFLTLIPLQNHYPPALHHPYLSLSLIHVFYPHPLYHR